jgi:hypothetical protein
MIKIINDEDERYITKSISDSKGRLISVRFTMKVYDEYVKEHGKSEVYHKTDRAGFKSPLIKEEK